MTKLSRKIQYLVYRVTKTCRTPFLRSWAKSAYIAIVSLPLFNKSHRRQIKEILSLELHASLTLDLRSPLKTRGIEWSRLSISRSSYLFDEPTVRLRHINAATWKSLDSERLRMFQSRYSDYLRSFDGFIVGYSLSLLSVFAELDRPILSLNATRFESPYTYRREDFDNLVKIIRQVSNNPHNVFVSNNHGDADYLEFYSGVHSRVLPNLCAYVPRQEASDNRWLILSKSPQLESIIENTTKDAIAVRNAFWSNYKYKDFARFKGIILIPYNISTMRLFELVSSGMPVLLPSDSLLMKWIQFSGVLSELSWVQVSKAPCPDFLRNSPADPTWVGFYDWWLERADWKFRHWFPNVWTFDSLDELSLLIHSHLELEPVEERNKKLADAWQTLIDEWISGIL